MIELTFSNFGKPKSNDEKYSCEFELISLERNEPNRRYSNMKELELQLHVKVAIIHLELRLDLELK